MCVRTVKGCKIKGPAALLDEGEDLLKEKSRVVSVEHGALAVLNDIDQRTLIRCVPRGERGDAITAERERFKRFGLDQLNALCHRRIREYPASGGPSTCCESFYDETMIEQAHRLLKSFGFSGVAMVEFKGNCVLEVNPRVWGSFPMTERAGSSLVCNYARAAAGERPDYVPQDYQTGVRMRFTLNDAAATLDYLRRGQIGKAFGGMVDFFRVKEALSAADDPKPLRHYLRSGLLKR